MPRVIKVRLETLWTKDDTRMQKRKAWRKPDSDHRVHVAPSLQIRIYVLVDKSTLAATMGSCMEAPASKAYNKLYRQTFRP